jgi:sulfhydrogenase subunit alpha
VDYLARVEGEGSLTLRIEDGVAVDAKLSIFEPPRFFEGILRGRLYSEAPDVTARICGICPVAYQMSACHAMEDALGITVTRADPRAAAAALLRRVDREPRAAHVHAARARLSRLPRRGRDGQGPQGLGQARGLRIKKAGNA